MDIPLTEVERVIIQGHAARRLLRDEDFAEVLNALSDYHLAAMVAAPPGKADEGTRDHHHLMLHALREVHSEISRRASALDDIDEEAEANTEELDD